MRRDVLIAVGLFAAMFMIFNAPGAALHGAGQKGSISSKRAGPAGAVAVLSVAENADAASLLANADATGRTTREKLMKANPFLKELTVGDLKSWADRKMRSY